ncbi:peptidylprolyl isomerase [archaeon]|nr:peptidylprolyl isomerase [archaeon]
MTNRVAVFDTSMGEFSMELFEDTMPITTGNFIKLANEGFYDGTRFHRVIVDFMIQGGDPQSTDTSKQNLWGTGGPGYAIEDEHVAGEKLSNVRGSISMANSGPQSGGSQFFINVVDNSFLDWDKEPSSSKHPVFGEVISGMSVVDSISNVATSAGDQPSEDIVVNSIKIVDQ